MNQLLQRLSGGVIVSVQAAAGSALDDPHVLAAMAAAAVQGGAVAVRIQGVANLTAVRKRVSVPIVGLVKRAYDGFEPYITPSMNEAREVLACGADIVAFDATMRPHPSGGETLEDAVKAIHAAGALAMADCATEADGVTAAAAGCDIVATTLCGYTAATEGASLPALHVVRAWRDLPAFVVCEGGIHCPEDAARAFAHGADAVVVGTAITNIAWVTQRYVQAAGRPA